MLPKYVIVTPARNEAALIELTIQSVIAQTAKPERWVIVSDGSTDGTDEIVKRYAAEYPWIELLRMPERRERHFAGKVLAFMAGYERLRALDFLAVVSLDADTSFDADYFAFLLTRLAADPTLGLVGTPFQEASTSEVYDYRFVSIEHVSGACQMFRRECFEAIGGYTPIKGGGVDHVAVISVRMHGWKTRTFTEKVCLHHRKMGTAQRSALMASFKTGGRDYALGGSPVWECFRTVYQMTKRPYLIAGFLVGAGYFWAMLSREERPVSPEFVAFRRREQMARLRKFLGRNRADHASTVATSH
jgi:glycosyltransferase involved in cell wall biosynthesis